MNRTNGKFEVPVEPLRQAFLRSEISASELARRLGWFRPDTPRLRRQLGFTGYPDPQETTSYERAIQIAEALGIDPVDVDL